MKVRAGMTVFSAVSFWLIASFLFALLEAGRICCLNTCADMSAALAVESVCAEYQPGLWEEYHLLGLDGAYGGPEFSADYVTAVLRERTQKNIKAEGAGGGVSELSLTAAGLVDYRIMTDGYGSVFLKCVSDYMKENLPVEAAQILYDRYNGETAVEEEGKLEGSVEHAQNAIDEARRQQDAGTPDGKGESAAAGAAGNPNADPLSDSQGQTAAAKEPAENPLEVALAWKRNTLLGMVMQDLSALSTKSIRLEDSVGRRRLMEGTMREMPEISWYDKILTLEYAGKYFSDCQTTESGHALAYELEYILCGKPSDRENLEGTVQRLLLLREAANVVHILSDSTKMQEALAVANLLAGFTGNPGIVQLVQIGVIAAWAYVESILDIRALLEGNKIALIKRKDQWTSSLGHLSDVSGKENAAKDCGDGFTYQDYLKGFLFAMDNQKLSFRMMDLMEKNLSLLPGYQNVRFDHLICEMECRISFAAEPLFWRFVVVSAPAMKEHEFMTEKHFSYYR